MNRQILRLAIPNIITNITVPLLGMVDTAIVGHIDLQERMDFIGAVAIGTMIFNVIYWNFGFLRMGTSGFTAQAYGAKDEKEQMNILMRACFIALIASFALVILQKPIGKLALLCIEDKNSLGYLAMQYFYIRIWAAPATLGMYAIKGWFIGMQDSKTPMWISILINILNIVFSFVLAIKMQMHIKGVAAGTLIAQWGGLLITLFLWHKKYRHLSKFVNWKATLDKKKLSVFFKANADIYLRTLCLIAVTTYFTIASSTMPYPLLAVNTLLMQLFTLFSYFMDGFAYASESLCGRFKGAGERKNLSKCVRYILLWGVILSAFFTLLYAFFGNNILSLLTNQQNVLDASRDYIVWTLFIPFCGCVAFLYDGILIGMTETRLMRNAIFIATALFFALYFGLREMFANNALWIAFLVYLSGRSILMMYMSRGKIFAGQAMRTTNMPKE